MGEHPQGKPFSRSTYTNHGCRCDGCRAANSAYMTPYMNHRWRTNAAHRAQHTAFMREWKSRRRAQAKADALEMVNARAVRD